jgi:peptidoglycan/LPS O-acetylase OafA/YrhL
MASRTSQPHRLAFIDNLRWSAISMVVVMHAAVTYSSFGRWYYRDPGALSLGGRIAFATYQSFQHAVSMGLLFGIAGYFAASAVDRKGVWGFLRERLFRLGVPLLVYMVLIGPITQYYIAGNWRSNPDDSFVAAWLRHAANGDIPSESGPLWFCLVLLVFSLGFAVPRLLLATPPRDATRPVPGVLMVLLYAGVMAAVTFAVGLVAPHAGVVLNVDVHDLPQYPLMFAAGVMAWQRDWLPRLPSSGGWRWLTAGLAGGGAMWFGLIVLGGALQGHLQPYGGGWHWQAAAIDVWRSFTCLALSLGLLTLYRDHCNGQGVTARFLTRNAFGVYMFHAPVLIMITRILHHWPMAVGARFVLASVAGVAASFLFVGFVVRRTPVLRAIV